MIWSLATIAPLLGAGPITADPVCTGVSIDSRTLEAGDLFFALPGPERSGAEFIAAAAAAGATGAVTDRAVDVQLPQLVVEDPVLALQTLALAWRQQFSAQVIGITGSNGKTTMRSLVAAACGPATHATAGNLNNHLGVPLVLLGLDATHRYAVVEMGANHVGEIARLAELAVPDIGIVTNAGPAHLEGFGSLDGVARGKGELFAALGSGATAVINRDDTYYTAWRERAAPAKVLTFGSSATADVRCGGYTPTAEGIEFHLTYRGERQRIRLGLRGQHNALNAAGAAAVALAAGRDWSALPAAFASVTPVAGRQDRFPLPGGHALVDDSYNANPASMLAAARTLVESAAAGWMVVGEMGELGPNSRAQHHALGGRLREAGVARVFALGERAADIAAGFGTTADAFESLDELVAAIQRQLHDDVTILVKGSRSARMERVVARLRGDS